MNKGDASASLFFGAVQSEKYAESAMRARKSITILSSEAILRSVTLLKTFQTVCFGTNMTNFSRELMDGESLELHGLDRINVILGRNGSGKSRLLRKLDELLYLDASYHISYITPERTGTFQRDANVEVSMASSPLWAADTRRANQPNGTSFKAMSHLALRNVEIAYLRALQGQDATHKHFQSECLDPICELLGNISIVQKDSDFEFLTNQGDSVQANDLSSGESETIALAAEVLNFFMAVDPKKKNWLLLDEPDVHQHPDLQARFGHYLLKQLNLLSNGERASVSIFIATHSTALVCALASNENVVLGTKDFGKTQIEFKPVAADLRKAAPFFGHPLSLMLHNDPLLVLEGEDDVRVWQQAARSSQGKVQFFPALAQSVNQQESLEQFCSEVLSSIYDSPRAYSVRDGDGKTAQIGDIGCVKRYRLNCYAIENLLVTTECLKDLGCNWGEFQALAQAWMLKNPSHQYVQGIKSLIESSTRLQMDKIKDIRNLIPGIANSTKAWEIVVGRALSTVVDTTVSNDDPFSIVEFIGIGAAKELLHVVQSDSSGPTERNEDVNVQSA